MNYNPKYTSGLSEKSRAELSASNLLVNRLTQQTRLRNLHALPARIQYLKDKDDIDGLEALRNSLVKAEEAQAYLPLISATIHQMQQDSEAALVDLLPVMQQPDSPILEQSLAMMVGLCTKLEYHQAVMDAMAGLASLNAYYLNLYSDALMANGQVIDAIDHLTEYLHYFPGDKQAWMKLKKWYAEQGSEEGVRLVESLLQEQTSD
jgi:predicted Zn-dependent protease